MRHALTRSLAALALLCIAHSGIAQTAAPGPVDCATCGVVTSVKYVEKQGEASGVGAVAGGVVGGVVGHQIGSGRGNTVATIAGVGVGAYAGNQVEKNSKKKSYYAVTVKLDTGEKRTLTMGAKPAFKQGDRVKVVDGNRLALLAN